LHGSADLARKTASDHEIAPRSILLRFETRRVDPKRITMAVGGTGHKTGHRFPPGEPSFDQSIETIGFTFIIC
jgi:hypothetical protein